MVNVGTDLFYDAAGNITQYDATSGDDTFLSYDARSNVQMITVGTSAGTTTPTAREQFWYDPNGQRYLGLETWDETEPFFMEIEFEGRTSTIVDEWCEGYARGVKLNPELWLSGGKEISEPLLAELLQKLLDLDSCLLEDGAQRAFRHIAGMVWDGGVAVGHRIVPDLVGAGGLAVEFEAGAFESLYDGAVAKASQSPHYRLTISG